MKMTGKHVILSLVCLVLGFIISYSYQLTKEEETNVTDRQWQRDRAIRETLINTEERNLELQQDLQQKQEEIRSIEEELATGEQLLFNLVEDVDKLRMYNGEVKVQGKGVEVTLSDASYVPTEENVNNYIVHESHVFKVMNELFISGADAVAINGQRITKDSYIVCNGPVITINGNQYPAPFVISAIGDPVVLEPALNILGGVKDQLVADNITVKIQKKDLVVLDPVIR
ncbi:DUF881 domain-containing protein [Sutcliffiella rhizosphaerae]|uniref:DUF881 domain-containing protein n=1 Tax=Sutcliffiella rhizosphaerae TaxID=2880967 RepID=A0ABM8YJ21_9BACI|nr:DUF881 domain-containing protein [Sutcliffiella rhizosphaerae]CAG9619800.1 hypothetical protein BACCIP111883_00568 [Sutcliffiella rhizosphaerae]